MRTYLLAKLGLLPLILFWSLVGPMGPLFSLTASLLLAGVILAWRGSWRTSPTLEIAQLVFFSFAAAVALAGAALETTTWIALSFVGLALLSLGSTLGGRPWTADYAASSFSGAAKTSIFLKINTIITMLWGVLFPLLAAATFFHWPRFVFLGIVVLGAALSVMLPRVLIRYILTKRVLEAEPYNWPAPALHRDGARVYDVAIVGAGVGGLTAAALLADAGVKVFVAEQHTVPGGYAHTWLRKTRHHGRALIFRFDSGVHDISGVRPGGPVTSVLRRLGMESHIDWRRVDHRYVFGGRAIDVARDVESHVRTLARMFPSSADGLRRFFADMRTIYDAMYSQSDSHGGIPGAPRSAEDMLAFAQRHPLAVRWLERPFLEFAHAYVSDSACLHVLSALTGYLTDDAARLTVADMAPIYGYAFHGGYYPTGGSGRLSDALTEAILRRGGTVRLKTAVDRIVIEEGRARGIVMAKGETLRTDAVVSNADLLRTYHELVGLHHLPRAFAERLRKTEPACSAFAVHLGLDYAPDTPPVIHFTEAGGAGVGIVLPSLLDPSAAPSGYATMEIMALLPHAAAREWFGGHTTAELKGWRRSKEYMERKRRKGDEMIAMAARVFPGLHDHIIFRAEASPVTFERYAHARVGAIYGIAGKSFTMTKSPIPGLVIAGAATLGAGIEAVVISGARAAEALVPGLLAQETTIHSRVEPAVAAPLTA